MSSLFSRPRAGNVLEIEGRNWNRKSYYLIQENGKYYIERSWSANYTNGVYITMLDFSKCRYKQQAYEIVEKIIEEMENINEKINYSC